MTELEDDQTDKPTAYIADLTDFQPDPDNLNLHTQRGQVIVTQSQQKRGYARPAFAASPQESGWGGKPDRRWVRSSRARTHGRAGLARGVR